MTTAEYTKNWRQQNKEQHRELHRKHRKIYQKRYRERYLAHKKLQYAIKAGKIKKQPCCICGDPNAQGHHNDYSKPLDVIWYCDHHHKEHHNIIKEMGS